MGGVSSTRNLGIDNSKGKFIVFVDSDDSVSPYYLQELYKAKEFGVCGFNSIEMQRTYTCLPCDNGQIVTKNICDMTAEEMFAFFESWEMMPIANKIFNKSIIDNYHIRFDEKMTNREDRLFIWNYFLHINSYTLIGKGLYDYNVFRSSGAGSYVKTEDIVKLFEIRRNIVAKFFNEDDVEKFETRFAITEVMERIEYFNSRFNRRRCKKYDDTLEDIFAKLSMYYIQNIDNVSYIREDEFDWVQANKNELVNGKLWNVLRRNKRVRLFGRIKRKLAKLFKIRR